MSEKWKKLRMSCGGGVHINIKKRTIMHNPQESWIRFETPEIIHIYGVGVDPFCDLGLPNLEEN